MENHAYDREVVSTPEGQESYRLRLEGRRLMDEGRRREALHLFQQALACHAETDDSAAAATARHDLAHVLSEGGSTTPWGLAIAERLFRQALKSPARARVKFRRAQTKSALGVCLRQQLQHQRENAGLSAEIERLYREALEDLEDSGDKGFAVRALVHQNLANFLQEHRDDIAQALLHYERAYSHARKHVQTLARGEGADPSLERILVQSRLQSALLLSQRKRGRDLVRAEKLVNKVLRERDPSSEDAAKLVLALVVLAGDAPDRLLRAQQLLAAVRLEQLKNRKQWVELAQALRLAGATDAALLRLRQFIGEGILDRARNTITDFMARIFAQDKQDALQAFLILENTSGLRFGEMVSEYAWRPETPLAQALSHERQRQMGVTYLLDTFARQIEPLTPDDQRSAIEEDLRARPQPSSPEEELLLRSFQRASQEQVPVRYLDLCIQEGFQRSERAIRALAQVDAGFTHAREVLGAELETRDLEALLRDHPGYVLLRVDIQEDLLAAAVWSEDGKVTARHTCLPLPSELFFLIVQASEALSRFSLQDHERLAAQLAALDLSAALPSGPVGRVVLLPSNLAAQLPLTALGPPGSRLIDRAESIIWLPCVYPLRIRPAPTPPRSGHVVALPSPEELNHVSLALDPPLPTEQRLEGTQASGQSLLRAAREAQTLCLFTHGRHPPGETPLLRMAQGQDEPLNFTSELLGIDRVEIWACQSGAHRPTDPLTPPANEAFGLDFQLLLQNGARTAIGTLWSVPQLSTSAIMRRYRWRALSGEDPARALAEAQRWWLREGLPRLMQLVREKPSDEEALSAFTQEIRPPKVEQPAAPVAAQRPSLDEEREAFLHHFEVSLDSAIAWAGIRFVGDPGQRPDKAWTPVEDRPLTSEERTEMDRLLSLPASKPHLDEQQEAELELAMALEPSASPSPSQALDVARRMRDRRISSHQDNLLTALAWLHEALAAPNLAQADRIRLSVEAAHLWLDLAWRELPLPLFPNPVALARAGRLLQSLPPGEDSDAEVARARHQYMERLLVTHSQAEHSSALRGAVERLIQVSHRIPPESAHALRAYTVTLELLALCPLEFRAKHGELVEKAQALAKQESWSPELKESQQRMLGALALHLHDASLPQRALRFFTPRELLLAAPVVGRQLPQLPGTQPYAEFMDQALSRLEQRLWGHTDDDGALLVQTTGAPGEAYRWLLKTYLTSHTQLHPDEASAKLACLQFSCDLRLQFLHHLVRLPAVLDSEERTFFDPLWEALSGRRMLLSALSDAALLPALPVPEAGAYPPHPLDPFTLPAHVLIERCQDRSGYTAWSLAQCCASLGRRAPAAPRTAAFEAVQASHQLETEARELWKLLHAAEEQVRAAMPDAPSIASLMLDGRSMPQNVKALQSLPEGEGVLGLSFLAPDRPLLMACWNDGTGQHQGVLSLEKSPLLGGLSQLLTFHPDDETPHRGRSDSRRQGWALVQEALARALEALLRDAHQHRKLRWRFLAPGIPRPLPLLGLRVGGVPLAARVESLTLVPSLGFVSYTRERQRGSADFTACLMVRASDQEGTTGFGDAAVETLRRLRPPQLVLDCHSRQGTQLPEAEALEAHGSRIRTVRLYSTGSSWSLNPTTAHLRLEGTGLSAWNLRGVVLPDCDVVELWASTGSLHTLEGMFRDEQDRIPGLVATFLANGAAAVIDLAWPVHDVVKALVCEQYGLLRLQEGHGSAQLARAIARVSELLSQLRSRGPYRTTRDVLERIDELRQRFALHPFGVDPRRLVAFADRAGTSAIPELPGDALVEELCQPVHLGAFRWWGS
jgi:hypothetical protein